MATQVIVSFKKQLLHGEKVTELNFHPIFMPPSRVEYGVWFGQAELKLLSLTQPGFKPRFVPYNYNLTNNWS